MIPSIFLSLFFIATVILSSIRTIVGRIFAIALFVLLFSVMFAELVNGNAD